MPCGVIIRTLEQNSGIVSNARSPRFPDRGAQNAREIRRFQALDPGSALRFAQLVRETAPP
jgi:hypothetical protein